METQSCLIIIATNKTDTKFDAMRVLAVLSSHSTYRVTNAVTLTDGPNHLTITSNVAILRVYTSSSNAAFATTLNPDPYPRQNSNQLR